MATASKPKGVVVRKKPHTVAHVEGRFLVLTSKGHRDRLEFVCDVDASLATFLLRALLSDSKAMSVIIALGAYQEARRLGLSLEEFRDSTLRMNRVLRTAIERMGEDVQ